MTVATLGAFAAAARYACYARQQVTEAHNANVRAAEEFKANERAYVSMGDSHGKLAEFCYNGKGQWTIAIYFYNVGRSPAFNFLVNSFHAFRGATFYQRHLYRFRNDAGTEEKGDSGSMNIPAGSVSKEYVDKDWELSKEQYKSIRNGGRHFMVRGTIEYCDEFGSFHCDDFSAYYKPPPFDEFISMSTQTSWNCVNPTPKPGWRALPRCRQLAGPKGKEEQTEEAHPEWPPWTPIYNMYGEKSVGAPLPP